MTEYIEKAGDIESTLMARRTALARRDRIDKSLEELCDWSDEKRIDRAVDALLGNSPRKEGLMPEFRGSKTEENLIKAFAGESMAHRRYTFAAQLADTEGYTGAAEAFRAAAAGETGHAFGHLRRIGFDPATHREVRSTKEWLVSAIAGELHENTLMYPEMAEKAREEGFIEIAEWFEIVGKAEASHAKRFEMALKDLSE